MHWHNPGVYEVDRVRPVLAVSSDRTFLMSFNFCTLTIAIIRFADIKDFRFRVTSVLVSMYFIDLLLLTKLLYDDYFSSFKFK